MSVLLGSLLRASAAAKTQLHPQPHITVFRSSLCWYAAALDACTLCSPHLCCVCRSPRGLASTGRAPARHAGWLPAAARLRCALFRCCRLSSRRDSTVHNLWCRKGKGRRHCHHDQFRPSDRVRPPLISRGQFIPQSPLGISLSYPCFA